MHVSLNFFSRKLILFVLHTLIVVASFLAALFLRFDLHVPEKYLFTAFWLLPVLVAVKLAIFWWNGLFSGWWRYISIPDLLTVLRANLWTFLALLPPALLLFRLNGFPRSLLVLDAILCFLLMGGVRLAVRMLREHLEVRSKGQRDRQKVLIVGAGAVGQTFVREIRQNPKLSMSVLGFIDSDPDRQKQRFLGVPVLGMPSDLPAILDRYPVNQVIVSQNSVGPKELRRIVEACRRDNVPSKILPDVGSFLQGDHLPLQTRDVQVEDLLGRPAVTLDIEQIRHYLRGKRILVTGAGGSIGSEICRQVALFSPERLVILDHAETPLFHIENELREKHAGLDLHPCLGDVRDRFGLRTVFATHSPQVVFHAAAYKHVPMSEFNPIEAVRNNIFGTRNVVDLADEFRVGKFVMISTDKAVNPTNVMGASKRAAEIYVQTFARRSATRMVTVRFGNVLGSNGSVVPIFRRQIAKGGPLTVTHPEVTRFFMTIPEAVQLVLQAGSMGEGGEIFLLDMGQPVKIVRLAEEMIRLSGAGKHMEIPIVFTGLRPGEKMHEELLLGDEGIQPTRHAKIKIARSAFHDAAQLNAQLNELHLAMRQMERERVLRLLRQLVPEFRPAKVAAAASPAVAVPAAKKRDLSVFDFNPAQP